MGTVQVLDAERMLGIEASSIVAGLVDGSGHLILTTHGGDTIDAGYVFGTVGPASTTQAGIAELATSAETSALTDATRVVTPAGLAAVAGGFDSRLDSLEATPGAKVQTIALPAEAAIPTSYPVGISITSASTGSGWSLASGFGLIVTTRTVTPDRCTQIFYSNVGGTNHPQTWQRAWHATDGGGGWTSWEQYVRFRDIVTTNSPNLKVSGGNFFNGTSVGAGTGFTVAVTFPAGRFTAGAEPRVFLCPLNSSRLTPVALSITATGFTARFDNWTAAAASAQDFNWFALKE